MNNYAIVLNEDAELWELWVNGKIVSSIWEWCAADKYLAEDLFLLNGHI